MKISNLVGERFKERPGEAVLDSHALLLRGGYIKQLGNGIFSLLPPAKRIQNKIEKILREEMDAIGAEEVTMPVVLPASVWEASGRYTSVGSELLRFADRNDSPMLLAMTHEEAAVQLVREYAGSYARYPFSIYQIQTKFRDEPRSRGGLIRVREFVMKDAYSFHTSKESLREVYDRYHAAYTRIFKRVGLPEVISVKADAGMMGGSVSHEFMLLCDAGEDSIILCSECGYKANSEAADVVIKNSADTVEEPYEEVATPDIKTIDAVTAFFKATADRTAKAVAYETKTNGDLILLFIRGDLEVNECRLRTLAGDQLIPARAETAARHNLALGYIGPQGLQNRPGFSVYFDESLKGLPSLIVGANKAGWHARGFNIERDFGKVNFVSTAKAYEGGICPQCGRSSLTVRRGIEVGNIFQLGTKYSSSMNLTYLDEKGEKHFAEMGSYGIGLGRLIGAICEARHDNFGPVWPLAVAPWQLHICALDSLKNEQVRVAADRFYKVFSEQGIEVIYDDRNLRPGVMFADADLLGVPFRLIISAKTLAEGKVEFKSRDQQVKEFIETDKFESFFTKLLNAELIKAGTGC
jgi:prolyl-tRNA synthetase